MRLSSLLVFNLAWLPEFFKLTLHPAFAVYFLTGLRNDEDRYWVDLNVKIDVWNDSQ